MATHAVCAAGGERIGVYEPVWLVAPRIGAKRTSWLQLEDRDRLAVSPARLESASGTARWRPPTRLISRSRPRP
jgi:hypothetical protein